MHDAGLTRPFGRNLRGLSHRAVLCLVSGVLRNFVKIDVCNAPDLRRAGPIILAPNHASFLDPPVVQLALRHHITFMMTKTIYSKWSLNPFFRLWDTIPVPEDGSSAGAMKGALKAIRRRRPVCIFPEGGISDDGYLQAGRAGVVTLMARAQVPVIPVAIQGTYRALPRGQNLIRPGRVTILFGAPISPPIRPSRLEVRAFADVIMDAIHDLGAPRRGEPLALDRFRP